MWGKYLEKQFIIRYYFICAWLFAWYKILSRQKQSVLFFLKCQFTWKQYSVCVTYMKAEIAALTTLKKN